MLRVRIADIGGLDDAAAERLRANAASALVGDDELLFRCDLHRSQLQNRMMAMKVLKARLYELEMQRREQENAAFQATKSAINFGSQIRNYVLAPYRLVKDTRTAHESSQVDNVLDGDIDGFIEAYLLAAAGGNLGKGGDLADDL